MFEHLVHPENRIEVKEVTVDRDGNVIQEACIGYGFGAFGSLSKDELTDLRINRYTSASVLVHYQGEAPKMSSGNKRYVAEWRGQDYAISSIKVCYDINGVLQGYRIYSSNA